MESFHKFLLAQVDLSEEEWNYISSFFLPKNFKKNTIVLSEGEVENHLYFIEKGAARYYVINGDGKEICLLFTFTNWFMGEMSSFLTKEPSLCFIETLSETTAWRIHRNDLQKIYNNTRMGDRIGRLAMEQLYIRKAQRERILLSETAEQRYIDLMKKAPHVLQQVPLKHIASYLGITPQALSRIRRRIS